MSKYRCGQFISMHDREGNKWLCRIVQHLSTNFCKTCDFYQKLGDISKCVAREDDRQKCILYTPILSVIKKVRICQKRH